MSGIIEITSESFKKDVLDVERIVILEFYSHSCPHCKRFSPIYDHLEEELKDQARFVKIDVLLNEDNRRLAIDRGIKGVPTIEVFYHGRVIGSIVGHHPFKVILKGVEEFMADKDQYIGPSTPLHELQFEPSFVER
jgi:thioredoxin 1